MCDILVRGDFRPTEGRKGRHESLFWMRAVLDIYEAVHLCTYRISNGSSDRNKCHVLLVEFKF